MQQFMLIFRGGQYAQLSAEEAQEHMQLWFKWMDELKEKTTIIATSPLERTGKQVTGKSKVITDGPFSEAKEMVGGYTLLMANSLEEATAMAEGCPVLLVDGMVEVRPLRAMARP